MHTLNQNAITTILNRNHSYSMFGYFGPFGIPVSGQGMMWGAGQNYLGRWKWRFALVNEILVWAPDLDTNTYQVLAIYQLGAHRTDPTRIKGAQNKDP